MGKECKEQGVVGGERVCDIVRTEEEEGQGRGIHGAHGNNTTVLLNVTPATTNMQLHVSTSWISWAFVAYLPQHRAHICSGCCQKAI